MSSARFLRSRGDVEEACDEIRLTPDVMAVNPANLPLSDHRHDPRNRPMFCARVRKLPEAEPRPDKTPLMRR